MADIIAEAGMSAGAIYLHFDGKQQIALAVAQRILGNRMTEFADRLRADGELPPPSAMLRLMMTGLHERGPRSSACSCSSGARRSPTPRSRS